MENPFVPGLELAHRFYREAVAPLLDRHVPNLTGQHSQIRVPYEKPDSSPP